MRLSDLYRSMATVAEANGPPLAQLMEEYNDCNHDRPAGSRCDHEPEIVSLGKMFARYRKRTLLPKTSRNPKTASAYVQISMKLFSILVILNL